MKKDDLIAAANFDELIAMIESARARAWQAVNSELVALYWNVGKWLSDKCAKANWGDKTIRSIAEHLAKTRPDIKGFSRAGLYRMRQFYEFYKEDEIVSPLVRQIDWKFRSADIGQIDFYLEALDRDVKKPDENPSVGVILCTDKDDSVVEYALSRGMSPTMVASYQLVLPDKKILQDRLRQITELVLEENQIAELPCSEEDGEEGEK